MISSSFFSRVRPWRVPLLVGAAVVAYIWVALSGPQGLQTLLEKHRQIRQMQEQNAEAARENELRRERIRRLEESHTEQELEIRKQLKKLHEGETTFILPDAPAEGGAAPASHPQ